MSTARMPTPREQARIGELFQQNFDHREFAFHLFEYLCANVPAEAVYDEEEIRKAAERLGLLDPQEHP